MPQVFVFGTLKRGFPNHAEGMAGETFLGDAKTVEAFPLVIAGKWFSPVMMPEPGVGHRVLGELYEVTPEKLKEIDRIESIHLPNGYRRHSIFVERTDTNGIVSAYVYMKDRPHVADVHSGYLDNYQDRRYVHRSQRPQE